MKSEIEGILGTIKDDAESWVEVFTRLSESGRVDLKTVIQITALLLDSLPITKK